MKQFLNVAIFGLSLKVMEQIKEVVIMAMPKQVSIKWCNIAEKNIDLLLVNDAFFTSSNIQKIILQDVQAYLRLEKHEIQAGQISGDFLYYPLTQSAGLSDWIKKRFFDYEYLNKTEQYIPELKKADDVNELKTVRKVLDEVFIPRNGFIQLMDTRGCFALVDTRTERIWMNEDNRPDRFNLDISQMYATSQFVNEFTQNRHAADLRMQLWPILLNSGFNLDVSPQECFKLTIWPQFSSSSERKNLLKMAACFAQGARISDVQRYLNLSSDLVERFVSTALLLRLGQKVETDAAKFSLNASESENSQQLGIKRFFGKLRKKLGL
jgi:hypothetical protein